ncbi:MAG TPA: hypothetical protein PK357_01875 [Candidatus Pacearchaeota archaeon]|nr:hypothetical protein [Candidatus Pacearchaeota archaeon]
MVSRIRESFERHSSFFRGMASLGLFWIYDYQKPSWRDNRLTSEQQDYLAIRCDYGANEKDIKLVEDKFNKDLSRKL